MAQDPAVSGQQVSGQQVSGQQVSGQQVLAWIEAERYSEAEAALRARLSATPGAPAVRFLLGKVLLAQFRFAEAELELEKAVALRGDRELWHHALATARAEQGQCQGALEALDRALALVDRPELRYDKAMCALTIGDFALAQGELERALALAPDHPRAHDQLGRLHSSLGNDVRARELLDRAVTLAPDNLDARYHLGLVTRRLGDSAAAIPQFESVVEVVPGHAGALYNLALALRSVGRGREARARLESFREVSRRDDLIDNQLQYIQLHPTETAPRLSAARLLLEAGRHDEARQQLEAARLLEPGESAVHLLLVEVYERLGQPVAAEQARRAAQRTGPGSGER